MSAPPIPALAFGLGHATASLLLSARRVFLRRRERGRWPELSDAAANVIVNGLTGVAVDRPPVAPGLRAEAVALAHRLVDDDHPETSTLWPPPGPQQPAVVWWRLDRQPDRSGAVPPGLARLGPA